MILIRPSQIQHKKTDHDGRFRILGSSVGIGMARANAVSKHVEV